LQAFLAAPVSGLDCSLEEAGPEEKTVLVSLRRTWEHKSRVEHGTVLGIDLPGKPAALIVSPGTWSFWRDVVRNAVSRAQPAVSLGTLNTWELRDLLDATASTFATDKQPLCITDMTRHSPLPSDDKSAKRMETKRDWTELSLEDAFSRLADEDAVLRKVKFRVGPEGRPAIRASVSRDAEFGVQGHQGRFYRAAVELGMAKAISRFQMLSGRERVQEAAFEPRPFVIEYPWPIFADVAAINRLGAVLQRVPHFSYSSTHTNPFLRASVLDEVDGSSCEIMVASHTRICLVPQTRSTPDSLSRLCAHVFDAFAEGTIRDLAEVVGAGDSR
jgi:hypothetical protein